MVKIFSYFYRAFLCYEYVSRFDSVRLSHVILSEFKRINELFSHPEIIRKPLYYETF